MGKANKEEAEKVTNTSNIPENFTDDRSPLAWQANFVCMNKRRQGVLMHETYSGVSSTIGAVIGLVLIIASVVFLYSLPTPPEVLQDKAVHYELLVKSISDPQAKIRADDAIAEYLEKQAK